MSKKNLVALICVIIAIAVVLTFATIFFIVNKRIKEAQAGSEFVRKSIETLVEGYTIDDATEYSLFYANERGSVLYVLKNEQVISQISDLTNALEPNMLHQKIKSFVSGSAVYYLISPVTQTPLKTDGLTNIQLFDLTVMGRAGSEETVLCENVHLVVADEGKALQISHNGERYLIASGALTYVATQETNTGDSSV